MDLSALIQSVPKLSKELMSSYCIVNGDIVRLDKLQNMGYKEFALRSKLNMPLKLYKYYPNVIKDENGEKRNFSIEALENNTVFLQTPVAFDDVYDSDINIEWQEYEKLRLSEYCKRCKIFVEEKDTTENLGNKLLSKLSETYSVSGNFENVFVAQPKNEIEKLANEQFILRVFCELQTSNDLGVAVAKTIQIEYNEYVQQLKNTFRTACFTTTPYSQLMWGGAYADFHKGFCIEYTVLPNDIRYQDIYYNLFPLIYCKIRPNMTNRLVKYKDKNPTLENLWDIYYHGALRKSIDWAFQNEWRLILPPNYTNLKESNYKIDFFPITKVFLGNRMSSDKRKEIIEICNRKTIPYVGVSRSQEFFEMQDCKIKCENCDRYTYFNTPDNKNI